MAVIARILPLRHTPPSHERCAVCRIGLSNKQRVVVAHQDPTNPGAPYIHPVHKKCLLQGYRINQLSDCYTCRASLDIQTLFPPEQRARFERVGPEEEDKISQVVRSVLFSVCPPVIELNWSLYDQFRAQTNTQEGVPWETVVYGSNWAVWLWIIYKIGRSDIEEGRIDRTKDNVREGITALAAMYFGLRNSSRLFAEPGVAVFLPLGAQLIPSQQVRSIGRIAFNALKVFRRELALGAGLGLVARGWAANENSQVQQVAVSWILVSQMLALAFYPSS